MANKEIKVTLVRSISHRLRTHKDCVRGLGISRMHQCKCVADTPENRGMINRVSYLLKVEEA